MRSWQRLAHALCGQWNVVGADLFSQPYKATWGAGDLNSDWDAAAQRIGDHLLEQCPRWLIFVQGVGQLPGAGRIDSEGKGGDNLLDVGMFWGENIVGARKHPIRLSDPRRLVYSPATFGPSTYSFPFFTYGKFPLNMPRILDLKFDFVQYDLRSPITFATLGDRFDTWQSQSWLKFVVKYCAERSYGFFVSSLGDDEDVGGLLRSDWTSPQTF